MNKFSQISFRILSGHLGELNGTLQDLPQIIDHLRAQGYEFVTVPTLLVSDYGQIRRQVDTVYYHYRYFQCGFLHS